MSAPLDLTYVVPVRWRDGAQRRELADYLEWVAPHCAEVIVVDGSPDEVFAANADAWGGFVTHVAPLEDERWLMGKVSGVRTGVRLASHERVVLADDDVRYDLGALRRTAHLLDAHDLVRPQNYFSSLPWHARWDTARTLLNRSLGRDYPGTLAVRRSRLLAIGLYDGDVLFENLELIRTVRADGGSEVAPLDLYVARIPPSAAHFWGQRTRQAYDDFALPLRMALWLAVVPLLALELGRFCKPGVDKSAPPPRLVPAAAAGAIAFAERGRRRAGGAAYFPASASLLAPVWVLERGICAWLAVLQRLRYGGVRYGDSVIPVAAHSERGLRARRRAGGAGRPRPAERATSPRAPSGAAPGAPRPSHSGGS